MDMPSSLSAITLILNLGSLHLPNDEEYNQQNLGFGFGLSLTPKSSFQIGRYENSISRISYYGSYRYTYFKRKDFSLGINVGGVSGYDRKLSPMLYLNGKYKFFVLNLTYIPPKDMVVLGYQLEF